MKILVLNSGSSSLKYQVIDTSKQDSLVRGLVDRIGMQNSLLKQKRFDNDVVEVSEEIISHSVAIEKVLDLIIDKQHGVLMRINEIDAVGHRVVHGGEKFSRSVMINDRVIKAIEEYSEIAPLHNPYNLRGINAAIRALPNVPQVAVFDTAFHATLPEEAYMYPIPYVFYEKYKIRRYGFHGTSHYYVSKRAAEILKRNPDDFSVITCHLGNGASVTAVKNGKSIETSLGFSTIAGVMMGTRCGDFDPAVILNIMEKEDLTIEQAVSLLTKHSGLLGVSGVSSDMREVQNAAKNGNKKAQLALKMFSYIIKKFIGSYSAVLGGADAIVFTAGIGENVANVREWAVDNLGYMGVEIDKEKNDSCIGKEMIVSKDSSKVKIIVIPTNEELVIAEDVVKVMEEADE
ncbi:MAG: acetate kinase [bacterium]|nr:acetate kinase [bacterium]